jgi:hypothetical protein
VKPPCPRVRPRMSAPTSPVPETVTEPPVVVVGGKRARLDPSRVDSMFNLTLDTVFDGVVRESANLAYVVGKILGNPALRAALAPQLVKDELDKTIEAPKADELAINVLRHSEDLDSNEATIVTNKTLCPPIVEVVLRAAREKAADSSQTTTFAINETSDLVELVSEALLGDLETSFEEVETHMQEREDENDGEDDYDPGTDVHLPAPTFGPALEWLVRQILCGGDFGSTDAELPWRDAWGVVLSTHGDAVLSADGFKGLLDEHLEQWCQGLLEGNALRAPPELAAARKWSLTPCATFVISECI